MPTSQNKPEPDSLFELQYAFTRHLRDPANNPAPDDIERRRIDIYSGLIYRNIDCFIANSFPVLRKITGDDDWYAMLRDYVKNHVSHTPYFTKMPLEFLNYLETERDTKNDPPFYYELACYEWVETSIMLDQRHIPFEDVDIDGDFLEGIPQLSPLVMPLVCQWPVHRISPDFKPEQAPEQASYLMVYRDRHHEVGFMELNPVSAKLLEALSNNDQQTGRDILNSIAKQLQHPDLDTVIKGGLEIMSDFRAKDILPGTRRQPQYSKYR